MGCVARELIRNELVQRRDRDEHCVQEILLRDVGTVGGAICGVDEDDRGLDLIEQELHDDQSLLRDPVLLKHGERRGWHIQ